jgi:hypothetical protein
VAVTGDAGGPYTVTFDADLGKRRRAHCHPPRAVAARSPSPPPLRVRPGSASPTTATPFAHVTRPSPQPGRRGQVGHRRPGRVSPSGGCSTTNPLQLEDQSVVDTFVGAETLDANRAVSFDMDRLMALGPLVTLEDFEGWLGLTLAESEQDRASRLLVAVSSLVRSEAGLTWEDTDVPETCPHGRVRCRRPCVAQP